MKSLLFTASLTLLCWLASAQYSFQKVDIDKRTNTSSTPKFFAEYKGKTYFIAKDVEGIELRVYDAANNSVSIATDPEPGPRDGAGFCPLHVLNNKLYYAGGNSTDGIELSEYDGVNPPKVLYDIQPGIFGAYPYILGSYNNRIYFADSSANRQDLFEYNLDNGILHKLTGTTGYQLIGVEKRGIIYDGKLYFIGIDTATGAEPYIYDPADSSISLLVDTYPGKFSGAAQNFMVANGKLYFTSRGLQYTYIHQYDGTILDTVFINVYQTIHEGGIVEHWGKMYFAMDTSQNGTFDNELFQLDIQSKTLTSIGSLAQNGANNMIVYNNKIFFNGAVTRVFNPYDNSLTRLDTINGSFTHLFMSNAAVCNNALLFNAGIDLPPASLFNIELCILEDATLSIKKEQKNSLFTTAYPNPVTGDAHLSFQLADAQTLSIQLTNISGQVIYRKPVQLYSAGKHDVTIPMQELPSGTYIYSVKSMDSELINGGKILKQ